MALAIREGRLTCLHTPERVMNDFKKFENTPLRDFVEYTTEWGTRNECPTPQKLYLFRGLRSGQFLSEYFHWQHRIRTGNIWFPSGHDVLMRWLREPEHLSAAYERIRRIRKGSLTDDQLAFQTVATNSALQTMTHFRASVSRYLATRERSERVLDFSAGWGDRLTGFLASDCVREITLIDPRPGSIDGCRRQHAFVDSQKTLHTLQMGAEVALPQIASNSVDLICSSPPYFDMEKYGETPQEAVGQIRHKVASFEEFLSVFLFPVLSECVRVLDTDGVLALNLDDNVRTKNFICEPALLALSSDSRLKFEGTAGIRKGSGFGQGRVKVGGRLKKAEAIYIFRKV